MALIKRTGGADFPDKLKALVSGPPKSGKTTLLGSIPNIVIADTEPHANNLASLAHLDVPYVTVNGTQDLWELHMVLNNEKMRAEAAQQLGLSSIDAVAIDTLDTLQKLMKKERLADTRSAWNRDDWGWLKDEMIKIIEAFTALPLHVVFCVHLKTQELGKGENKYTVTLPGLEGAIAGEIAGMVGYSLLSFRKEEPDGEGGKPVTRYWLRAEGDETYDFLGTRTAGRLPAVIKPDFKTVYDAAMAGRPAATTAEPVQLQTPQPPQQQAPPPAQFQQGSPPQSGPNPGPDQQAQQQAQQGPPPAERAPDDQPVNDVALQHVKRVYDALSMPFPEETLKAKTLGDARSIVMMWKAIQQDYAEGKGKADSTAESDMAEYLEGQGLGPGDAQMPAQPAAVTPKIDGNIDEVKAYVGDDLARANEAFEVERTGKNRQTLMKWLESKGARHGGAAPQEQAPQQQPQDPAPQPQEQVQTDVQTPPDPAPQSPTEGVTPPAPQADAEPTEEQATQAASEGLGAEVVGIDVNAGAICEVDGCGKPIDDPDIARLAKTRYGKVTCVDDYIKLSR